MNWKRGLFRIWIVASLLWFIFVVFYALEARAKEIQRAWDVAWELRRAVGGPYPEMDFSWQPHHVEMVALIVGLGGFGFPLLVLALSATIYKVVGWICRGFRTN